MLASVVILEVLFSGDLPPFDLEAHTWCFGHLHEVVAGEGVTEQPSR